MIDGHDLPAEEGVAYSGMIEPQNWRPPDEKELIFSRYSSPKRTASYPRRGAGTVRPASSSTTPTCQTGTQSRRVSSPTVSAP